MAELVRGTTEIETEHITIRGASAPRVDAIHSRPTGMPIRGIVLLPDIFGLRPLFEDLAERLASHGAAVIAIEPFASTPAGEREAMTFEERATRISHLDDEELMGDLESAATFLITEDDVAEVAVLGFCYGGHQAFKAAATDDFDRAVAFYGMVHAPEHWQGPTRTDPMAAIGDVCPTLAIFGDHDTFVPNEHVEELRSAWSGRNDCQIQVYPGAEHGFIHDPARPAHLPEDAADAWSKVLAFLGLP
ncbi:MAG: dienelactone hydrolase family protein [Acidimicrobiia bacterium]